jgi:uncharacterized protein (DUF2252 family)
MSTLVERIQLFNASRIPEMVQLKYQFMSENMFRFYRGTAHLFYEDLAKEASFPSSPLTWISGDLHLENFGTYKGDNRLVYFDLNDFDEAILAPAAWELARTITSILVASRSQHIEEEKALRMAKLFLKTYSCTLRNEKAKYIESKTAKGIVCDFLKSVASRRNKDILNKRTIKKKDKLIILLDDVRHLKIEKPLKKALTQHLTEWLTNNSDSPYHFKVEDAVFRIAGTGSVGVQRYAFLLKSSNTPGKYLLLDMKQAVPSSLKKFVPVPQPAWTHEAERVITIQKRMQNISPALLSATVFNGHSFVIQEMQPVKDNFNFKFVKDRYRDMYQAIDDMAMLTASAQLRSAGRQGSAIADELISFGQDDNWQEKVLSYCVQQCDTIERNYTLFTKATGFHP